MKQPKILILTYEYGDVVYAGVGRTINGVVPKMEDKADIDVFLLKPEHSKGTLITNRQIASRHRELEAFIKSENYNILHVVNNTLFLKYLVERISALLPSIKIIRTVHSLARQEYLTGKVYLGGMAAEDYLTSNTDLFHVLTKFSARSLEHFYPYTAGVPKRIIPNGINEEDMVKIDKNLVRAIRKNFGAPHNKIVLCYSRWTYGKGLEMLVDSAPHVLARCNNVKFIIAGRKESSWERGHDKYTKMLDKKINSLKEHVIPLKWLNDIERNSYLSLADVFVMPSLSENFPYGILEPMITKVPIVSSRIAGIPEIIREGHECLFYNSADPKELASKIVALLKGGRLRKMLAENAYRRAKCDYSWDRIAKMYLRMYASVLRLRENDYSVSEKKVYGEDN